MSVVQLQDLGQRTSTSSWNMFVTAKGERVVALSKGRLYGSMFFMETAITGIVYLDTLQQFLIPQLDEVHQEAQLKIKTHFSQGAVSFNILQRNCLKTCIFRRSATTCYIRIVHDAQFARPLPPQKFARPPCYHYWVKV
jgi:hypothetical protein